MLSAGGPTVTGRDRAARGCPRAASKTSPHRAGRGTTTGRVLLVGAFDPERAQAQLDEVLEVLEADEATQRSITR